MEFYEFSNPIADNFVIDVDQGVIGGKANKVIQQGEHDARYLQVELVQNGVPVDLTNCDVYFLTRSTKSNTKPTMTLCEIFDTERGNVKVQVKNYMTNKDGGIECEFVRIGHDKTILPFKKFNLTVDGSIYTDDAIESSEPLHALVDALATVREVEQYLGSEFMDLEAKYAGELSETKNQVLLSKKELNDKINEEIEKTNTQLSNVETIISNGVLGKSKEQVKGIAVDLSESNFENWVSLDGYKKSLNYIKSKGFNSIQLAIHARYNISTGKMDELITMEHLVEFLQCVVDLGFSFIHLKIHPVFDASINIPITIRTAYKNLIIEYAKLCEIYNVKLLTICNENKIATVGNRDSWNEVVSAIKLHYSGLVSVSPTIEEASEIDYWGIFDCICFNCYPTLTHIGNNATIEECISGCGEAYQTINLLSGKYKKPIYITEVGCQPYAGRLGSPGISNIASVKDYNVQILFFNTVLTFLTQNSDKVDGFFIWESSYMDKGYSPLGNATEPYVLNFIKGGEENE